mmetsp:Transcript_11968/g.38282  ORF Transcript_11968/g.38282 Transcript_11968/m.38282 type:complete len:221 (+) Transcript_11968:190-852(+)
MSITSKATPSRRPPSFAAACRCLSPASRQICSPTPHDARVHSTLWGATWQRRCDRPRRAAAAARVACSASMRARRRCCPVPRLSWGRTGSRHVYQQVYRPRDAACSVVKPLTCCARTWRRLLSKACALPACQPMWSASSPRLSRTRTISDPSWPLATWWPLWLTARFCRACLEWTTVRWPRRRQFASVARTRCVSNSKSQTLCRPNSGECHLRAVLVAPP